MRVSRKRQSRARSDEGDCRIVGGEAASADEVTYQHGDRRWRVRGLARNDKPGVLRVNLFVSRSVSAPTTAAAFTWTPSSFTTPGTAAELHQAGG